MIAKDTVKGHIEQAKDKSTLRDVLASKSIAETNEGITLILQELEDDKLVDELSQFMSNLEDAGASRDFAIEQALCALSVSNMLKTSHLIKKAAEKLD